MSQVMVK